VGRQDNRPHRLKRSLVFVPLVAGGVALAGCGSGAKRSTPGPPPPPTTVAGVVLVTSGRPPTPSTPTGCARRWNGATNTTGRGEARQHAPNARSAHIAKAKRGGYFGAYAGRCLVYLVTPPKTAAVFVETAPRQFQFTGDATGHFPANADLHFGERLGLR
jgi:hypothetical protein